MNLTIPTVREACIDDAIAVALHLRDADRREIDAYSGNAPVAEMVKPFLANIPKKIFAIDVDGPIALFGVHASQRDPRIGIPWLLASDDFPGRCRRELVKQADRWVKELMQGYDALENHVYACNDVHVYWIKRLGFRVVADCPQFGRGGERFLKFRLNHSEIL